MPMLIEFVACNKQYAQDIHCMARSGHDYGDSCSLSFEGIRSEVQSLLQFNPKAFSRFEVGATQVLASHVQELICMYAAALSSLKLFVPLITVQVKINTNFIATDILVM